MPTPSTGDSKWFINLEAYHLLEVDSVVKDMIYTMDIDRISKNIFSSKTGGTSTTLGVIHGTDFNAFSSRFGAEIADVSSLMLSQLTITFRDTITGDIMENMNNPPYGLNWSCVLCIYEYNS
jgi:hypothetical protein